VSNDWSTPPWEEDDEGHSGHPGHQGDQSRQGQQGHDDPASQADEQAGQAGQTDSGGSPQDQPGDWFSVTMEAAVSGNDRQKYGGNRVILPNQSRVLNDAGADPAVGADAIAGAFTPATTAATARASGPTSAMASAAVQALDPLTLPLSGSRLIEASAGTGKTYTIAQLYLRLVLGHGPVRQVDGRPQRTAFARALTPPEILVVTFTEAATNELRERIRQRLSEAAQVFEAGVAALNSGAAEPGEASGAESGEPSGQTLGQSGQASPSSPHGANHPADPAPSDLAALRDDFAPHDWAGCAKLLRVAADWMDEAAVSTIHAWCYRMLREHAFDSGNLFTQTLLTDETELQLQAAQDYWRQQFYGLNGTQAKMLTQVMKSPEALIAAVRPLLGQGDAPWRFGDETLDPTRSPVAQLAQVSRQAQHAERLQTQARAAWAADVNRLEALFRQWLPVLHGNTYRNASQNLAGWLLDLRRWSQGELDTPLSKDIRCFGLSGIKLKGGQVPPAHPAFIAIDDWQSAAQGAQAQADLARLKAQLLAHATWQIRRTLAAEKLRRAELGFDDVLRRLHAALTARHGSVLAERIRRQFPVAMIDEFQDTDPIQWAMFDAVYRVSSQQMLAESVDTDHSSANETEGAEHTERPEDASALLLIGDPKQAIYGFRGADIHTYLQARRATAGRHYSLGTNYRSTQALVGAVNAVFGHAEASFDEAAFRFAHRFMGGPGDNPMPFLPVAAKGRGEQLLLGGHIAPAMTWWWLAPEAGQEAVSSSRYQRDMAQACATQMADWLRASGGGGEQRGQIGGEGGGGTTGFLQAEDPLTRARQLTPLRPRDMAVLVRHRGEADAIRSALAARGIASAYLSERESVFESPEAQDLSVWLEAVHSNAQASRLRAALGTASLGRSHAWLERLNHDEVLWDEMVMRFRGYGALWRGQGVLPMVRQLLHDFALPPAWLSLPGGARTLTNVLHLAEWLQTQAQQLDSPQALMRALAQQIEQPGDGQDGARLRLESDDDLVKVVTIHKSKGLEYPLVLLPFIGSWRARKADSPMVLPTEDESGARRVNLDLDDAGDQQLARLEQQREDLRLLYVALTRARHAVWLGVAPLSVGRSKSCQVHDSALGYLLGGPQARKAPLYRLQLEGLCQQHPRLMRLMDAPTPRANPWQAQGDAAQHAATHAVTRATPPRWWQPWWIASYSAITSSLMDEDGAALVGSEAAPPLVSPLASQLASPLSPGLTHSPAAPAAPNAPVPEWPLPQQPPHTAPDDPASEDSYELSLAAHLSAELLDGQALAALDEDAAESAAQPGDRDDDDDGWWDSDGDDAETGDTKAGDTETDDAEGAEIDRGHQALHQADQADHPRGANGSSHAHAASGLGPSPSPSTAQGIHAFARGAEVGTFWHELLQLAALQGFARVHAEPDKLSELVARRARVRGWGEHAPALTAWLLDWLRAPMPLSGSAQVSAAALAQQAAQAQAMASEAKKAEAGAEAEEGANVAAPTHATRHATPIRETASGDDFGQYSSLPLKHEAASFDTPSPIGPRLIELTPTQLQAELEFWLPVHEAAVPRIDALVRAHIEPGRPRPRLAQLQLRGMLKGYMDLVFQAPAIHLAADPSTDQATDQATGRFHVLDYKSNWLGPDEASYHPDAVRDAALASRYDLQAALYLLALHRLLRSRLPHYQPERHLGSSLTWFLRGSARLGGSVWACHAPLALLNALDALFDGAPAAAGSASSSHRAAPSHAGGRA
jgi:exodeoxyribonuclease V beta subunit